MPSFQCCADTSATGVMKPVMDVVTGRFMISHSSVTLQNNYPYSDAQHSCAVATCDVNQNETYNRHLQEIISKDDHEVSKKILQSLEASKQIRYFSR